MAYLARMRILLPATDKAPGSAQDSSKGSKDEASLSKPTGSSPDDSKNSFATPSRKQPGQPRGLHSPRNPKTDISPFKSGKPGGTDTSITPRRFDISSADTETATEVSSSDEDRKKEEQHRLIRRAFPITVAYQKEVSYKEVRDGKTTDVWLSRLQAEKQEGHPVIDFARGNKVLVQALESYVSLTRMPPEPDTSHSGRIQKAKKALDPLQKQLDSVIESLGNKPEALRQPTVLQGMKDLQSRLTTERHQLSQLGKSTTPRNASLFECMQIPAMTRSAVDEWQRLGFDQRDMALGQLGDLSINDLRACAQGIASEQFAKSARELLIARAEFPHMNKADFIKLAPILLARGIPHELLKEMAVLGIEPNAQNLPGGEHLRQADRCKPVPLGKGVMGTAFRLNIDNEEWVFKPEQKEPSPAGMAAGIPIKGANTAGRILASAKVSALLGLKTVPDAAPFWLPPMDGQPGRYGSISRLVTGPMVQSNEGARAVHKLNHFEMTSVGRFLPEIQAKARLYGFDTVVFDSIQNELQLLTQKEFRRPLEFKSHPLLQSLSEVSVVEIMTGQVDNHAGNLLLENGESARMIDTAEAFPKNFKHPLDLMTEPWSAKADWDGYFTDLVKSIGKSETPPNLPEKVDSGERDLLLQIPSRYLGPGWEIGLTNWQVAKVELELQHMQMRLRQVDAVTGIPTIPDSDHLTASANNRSAHTHGWPAAVSTQLKANVLQLTEDELKQSLAGLVTPEEADATWSRTAALQNALRQDGLILEVKTEDGWTSAEATSRMGLEPGALDHHAHEVLNLAVTEQEFAWTQAQRRVHLKHGLTGALALEELMSRMQADGVFAKEVPEGPTPEQQIKLGLAAPKATTVGHALFDPRRLLTQLGKD
ncbi:MAG: hypothetical protein KGZ46_04545 [Hydrogenophaga sp.]|nr:hypothetical protein [Hydrogenophaga sp.]